jgi:hypothetical protein
MTAVTRHALRVYSALSELKGDAGGDVLEALIPFFEPILRVMNGRVFDPKLLATGVRRLYRWNFTRDIAEQFIPRLERKGYLKRRLEGRQSAFVVTVPEIGLSTEEEGEIGAVLKRVLDEFQAFVAGLGGSQPNRRTRDQLLDILIRFLVSVDAFGPSLPPDIAADAEGADALANLEEGGRPLSTEDRYLAARFVQHVAEKDAAYVPQLVQLASIGLLVEVVDDFIKPTSRVERVDLTVVLDAPVALDYLGLSGKALEEDVKSVLSALTPIGCKVIVFPTSFTEMQQNLQGMLSLSREQRRGYPSDAARRGDA